MGQLKAQETSSGLEASMLTEGQRGERSHNVRVLDCIDEVKVTQESGAEACAMREWKSARRS